MIFTRENMRAAAQQLQPGFSDAKFNLLWAGFMRERRRRERSRLYRWWTNVLAWMGLL